MDCGGGGWWAGCTRDAGWDVKVWDAGWWAGCTRDAGWDVKVCGDPLRDSGWKLVRLVSSSEVVGWGANDWLVGWN